MVGILNADIKYVNIETDVQLKGAATGNQWRKVDALEDRKSVV